MACPCPCCGKTGACCVGAVCTQETCADCEALGGLWQGYDTECDGSDCPCDPPADHTACEKCVDGEPVDRCPDGYTCCDGVCCDKNCCNGVCQEEPCVACAGTCSDTEPCATGCGCVYTGNRMNSDGDFGSPGDGKPPDPYTPDPGDTAGECCVGAAVYSVTVDENGTPVSPEQWDLLSDDCPDGYSPPTGSQGEITIFYAVSCCVENTFP